MLTLLILSACLNVILLIFLVDTQAKCLLEIEHAKTELNDFYIYACEKHPRGM